MRSIISEISGKRKIRFGGMKFNPYQDFQDY